MRESKYSRPITIALSQEVYSKVKEIGDREKVSMAEVIRDLLNEGLAKKGSSYKSKSEGE